MAGQRCAVCVENFEHQAVASSRPCNLLMSLCFVIQMGRGSALAYDSCGES